MFLSSLLLTQTSYQHGVLSLVPSTVFGVILFNHHDNSQWCRLFVILQKMKPSPERLSNLLSHCYCVQRKDSSQAFDMRTYTVTTSTSLSFTKTDTKQRQLAWYFRMDAQQSHEVSHLCFKCHFPKEDICGSIVFLVDRQTQRQFLWQPAVSGFCHGPQAMGTLHLHPFLSSYRCT